jgi:predicted alpha/beta-hydrolase family hydrolase
MARKTTAEERVAIEAPKAPVTGAWSAVRDARAVLVVAPGAGGTMQHPFLVGFTRALNDQAIATLRFNFPYQEAGRRSPDTEPVLRDTWLAAFEWAVAQAGPSSVLVGGKSLGGRIASMVVADGMAVAGLVLLGYPLHPPGRPERIRDEHLYRIEVPMLFIQGTADPFARRELLAGVLAKLGDRATHDPVEGGDHSFRVKGVKAADRDIGAGLAELASPFVEAVASGAS